MTNIVFIKGAKQSVVDFINRGLVPNLMADFEASYKVLEDYVKDFLRELDESFLEDKHK